jgi:type IV pilus assembly protein PilB
VNARPPFRKAADVLDCLSRAIPAEAPLKTENSKTETLNMAQRKLGQILVDLGYINDDQLWDILEEQKQSPGDSDRSGRGPHGTDDSGSGDRSSGRTVGHAGRQSGRDQHPPNVLELVPQTMAEIYKIMPISLKNGVLTVAMADPQNVAALDDLRNFLGWKFAERFLPDLMLKRRSRSTMPTAKKASKTSSNRCRRTKMPRRRFAVMTWPLMKKCQMRSHQEAAEHGDAAGHSDQASDIHFEPFEDEFKIRVKADGVLYEMVPPPRHLANAIVSRIKVMSNLTSPNAACRRTAVLN